MAEMFLDALGVPFATIKSSMSMEERTANAKLVNDKSQNCSCLVTNHACGALSPNLQEA
jgi:hypothetical protein